MVSSSSSLEAAATSSGSTKTLMCTSIAPLLVINAINSKDRGRHRYATGIGQNRMIFLFITIVSSLGSLVIDWLSTLQEEENWLKTMHINHNWKSLARGDRHPYAPQSEGICLIEFYDIFQEEGVDLPFGSWNGDYRLPLLASFELFLSSGRSLWNNLAMIVL
jgi:hypothetical protein